MPCSFTVSSLLLGLASSQQVFTEQHLLCAGIILGGRGTEISELTEFLPPRAFKFAMLVYGKEV